MIEALMAWLVATFLLGPLQSQIAGQMEAARAPTAVMRQVTECVAAAAPGLAERAVADPWWAIGTAFGAWTGTVRPAAVLGGAAPSCGAAMEAARPYLTQG
jgi:hypothetical protein